MRELTKSMLSFSWAMSLFGAQQAARLLSPSKAAEAFDHVTQSTRQELEGVMQTAFRAGDELQREMTNLAFGVVSLETLNPSRMFKAATDAAQQTVKTLGRLVPGGACGAGSQPTGWGPVPSPEDARQSR